jgi:hypothetical protein
LGTKVTPDELLAKVAARIDETAAWLDPAGWYDLWHDHPDWDAEGNETDEHRSVVASETIRLMKLLEGRLAKRPEPWQVFASFATATIEDAAVYVHTPNPNGTPFPHSFDDFVCAKAVPPWLERHLPGAPYIVLEGRYAGDTWYVIHRPN